MTASLEQMTLERLLSEQAYSLQVVESAESEMAVALHRKRLERIGKMILARHMGLQPTP